MDFKAIMAKRDDPSWEFFIPKEDFEEVPIKGAKLGLFRSNGHLLPRLCRNLTEIKNMGVREDDTLVLSYPKSGTHWVAELCWLIQNNGDTERAKNEPHMKRTTFIDMGWSNKLLNQYKSPRVYFSHLRHCFLPDNIETKAKVVYVARNPKDVLVSMFFFLQSNPHEPFDGNMADLFDGFVSGKIMYDSWWDHINEFSRLQNIHFVHYEDLLEDGLNETRKIAKFLGKGDMSDEQLKVIVDFCSFDNLKKAKIFDFAKKEDSSNNSSENDGHKKAEFKLLRKGEIGDWKNYLNEDMSMAIDEILATKLENKKPFKLEPTAKN